MVKAVLGFILGAGVGAGVTYLVLKDRFNSQLDEEVESVKKYYAEKAKSTAELNESAKSKIAHLIDDSLVEVTVETEERKDVSSESTPDIFVISPEEYNMHNVPFDNMELMYYPVDDVLANEDDEIIEDVKSYIGDALQHFGEYEAENVYVRNTILGMDIDVSYMKDKGFRRDVIGE